VLTEYKEELVQDPHINAHLSSLYDTLLEQNLVGAFNALRGGCSLVCSLGG
jgi:hypothetical protein